MSRNKLYGALLGDIAGSIYEFKPLLKGSEASLNIHDPKGYITDDSLLTLAMADAIISNKDTVQTIKDWSNKYDIPGNKLGFGLNYRKWIKGNYINDSWGNGALMRVSPFIWKNDYLGAINSVNGSHEHQESKIAVTLLYQLYQGYFYSNRAYKAKVFEKLDESCKGTIDFICDMWWNYNDQSTQNLILKTIRYNGDCDTNASILGELSNYHKNDLTKNDIDYVNSKLDSNQLWVLEQFNKL